jgi:hypothetical protein
MTPLALKSELMNQMNKLPITMQCQVLQFARALEMSTHAGVSGAGLMSFAGCIPPDDLEFIAQAVEAGCEPLYRLANPKWPFSRCCKS